MLTINKVCLIGALCFSGLLSAQTQKIAAISSSYPVTMPSGSSFGFTVSNIGVAYPTGLTPGSYISGTQLNTDFQSFLSAYPSPTDPPEAILSTVLQAILNKYPQLTGGTLSGLLAGTIMGIPVPVGGGNVSVVIGTYSLVGLAGSPALTEKAKPISTH